jgi:hypothetical protein
LATTDRLTPGRTATALDFSLKLSDLPISPSDPVQFRVALLAADPPDNPASYFLAQNALSLASDFSRLDPS